MGSETENTAEGVRGASNGTPASECMGTASVPSTPSLRENEFGIADVAPGQIGLVHVNGERVAVYNVDGAYHATQDHCIHTGWPLSDGGELSGTNVTCPLHGWCFNVTNGEVVRGMRSLKLKTFRVRVEGDIARVEEVD